MSWMFSILMCCPGPGTSERSEITKPWRSQAKEKPDQVTWREADFSRSFNQPHDHMMLPSISNFQIRVAQAIQTDLLIPPPTKNQDENLINSRCHSVGFWPLKEWKNWHQNIVWVLLELAHLASYNIQMIKIHFIFHSNETWWDHFSAHLLYPLVNDFWKLKPNTQLGAQTSSMRTTRPFNRDAHQV